MYSIHFKVVAIPEDLIDQCSFLKHKSLQLAKTGTKDQISGFPTLFSNHQLKNSPYVILRSKNHVQSCVCKLIHSSKATILDSAAALTFYSKNQPRNEQIEFFFTPIKQGSFDRKLCFQVFLMPLFPHSLTTKELDVYLAKLFFLCNDKPIAIFQCVQITVANVTVTFKITKIIAGSTTKTAAQSLCGLCNAHTVYSLSKTSSSISLSSNNQKINPLVPVAGFKKQLEFLRRYVINPLKALAKSPENMTYLPSGVLLVGPHGVGKTFLAKRIMAESGFFTTTISGPDLFSKYVGETEQRLKTIFENARKNAPSIVFIDELDALCHTRGIGPGSSSSSTNLNNRLVPTLSSLLDSISAEEPICVLAATHNPDQIDSSLRRAGRFDKELDIPIPTPFERFEILKIYLGVHAISDTELIQFSETLHGYVSADIVSLVQTASLLSLERMELEQADPDSSISSISTLSIPNSTSTTKNPFVSSEIPVPDSDDEDIWGESQVSAVETPETPQESKKNPKNNLNLKPQRGITIPDLEAAQKSVTPSAMRQISILIPSTTWDDIAGYDSVKEIFQDAIILPRNHPELYSAFQIQPTKGFLLYGPPGCSKTMMAKAVANEAKLNFLTVKGPELLNKYVGSSEKGIRELFRKARAAAPSIIFFDEIDSFTSVRHGGDSSVTDRMVSSLLNELDGFHELKDVYVIAATNRKDAIDPALLRPGRFGTQIYVDAPDLKTRKSIFELCFRKTPVSEDVKMDQLAEKTINYTGAECVSLVRESALSAIKRLKTNPKLDKKVLIQDIETALKLVVPKSVDLWKQQTGFVKEQKPFSW